MADKCRIVESDGITRRPCRRAAAHDGFCAHHLARMSDRMRFRWVAPQKRA